MFASYVPSKFDWRILEDVFYPVESRILRESDPVCPVVYVSTVSSSTVSADCVTLMSVEPSIINTLNPTSRIVYSKHARVAVFTTRGCIQAIHFTTPTTAIPSVQATIH